MLRIRISLFIFFLFITEQICAQQLPAPPATIDDLFEKFFQEIIERNPEYASQLGLTPEMGYVIDKGRLTDFSQKAIDEEFAIYHRYRHWLDTYHASDFNSYQKISVDIFRQYLDLLLAGERFKNYNYLINPFFGTHVSLLNLLVDNHTIDSLQNAYDYISRLEDIPKRINDMIEGLAIRKSQHIMPPRHIIHQHGNELNLFINKEPSDNIFFIAFVKKLQGIEIADEIYYDLVKRVEEVIKYEIYPAYQELRDYLYDLTDIATDDDGVWKLPEGKAYYDYCLRVHTTTNLSADKIHNIGIIEVKRIQKELKTLLTSIGFINLGRTFGQYINQYQYTFDNQSDDKFRYPNDDNGEEQVLLDYQTIIDDTQQRLPEFFSLLPKAAVTVKAIPAYLNKSTFDSYHRASVDKRRAAVFYANLANLPFKPGMKTLVFHETIPGHHLQIAIAQEYANNYMFKNLLHFTGFKEGWALYAEKLAYENSWFVDVHERIAYLRSELFRAVRLVVDTGIHHKQWPRKKAYLYMRAMMGWSSYKEIDRYILWPGQACAYKIGELKILELRKKMMRKRGKEFNIKDFHRVVLQNGDVPLNLLEKIVEEYIAMKRR